MTTRQEIDDFLSLKRLAIVGVSRNQRDFSRMLFRELRQRGYDVVAVNPGATEMEGGPCFSSIGEVSPPVEGALLMTQPAATETLVRACAAAGVHHIWMHRGGGQGAVSEPAVEFCRQNGIPVVPGECPFMFLPRTGWIHQAHGFCRRLFGAYPS